MDSIVIVTATGKGSRKITAVEEVQKVTTVEISTSESSGKDLRKQMTVQEKVTRVNSSNPSISYIHPPNYFCEQFNAEYQKRLGWITSFVFVFLVAICFNLPIFVLIIKRVPYHPISAANVLMEKALFIDAYTLILKTPKDQRTLAQNNTVATTPLTEFLTLALGAMEEKELLFNNEDYRYAWHLCLIAWAPQVFCSLVILLSLFCYRKHNVVKSRTTIYLLHLLVVVPPCLVFSLLFSGLYLFQITQDPGLLKDMAYASSFLFTFFSIGWYSALTCRMRTVNLAFSETRYLPVTNGFYRFLEYGKIIPIHLLFFIVAIIPVTIDTYFYEVSINGHSVKALPIAVIILLIFPFWIFYYTYRCRKISLRYSDFYTNIRITLYISVLLFLVFLSTFLNSSYLCEIIGYQFAFQSISLIYLLDVTSGLCYVAYRERQRQQSLKSQYLEAQSKEPQVSKRSTSEICSLPSSQKPLTLAAEVDLERASGASFPKS